ncbi:hypothetical protein [Salinarimonas rosea]|uniref:hypothetical protein n=1 Tax=Salinarimonas rosea TaxID=552063 RepID=UPI00040350ED|nr:hypothetical protein [Salinarimonas rosea]
MIVPSPGAVPRARTVRYEPLRHAPDLDLCCAAPGAGAAPRFLDDTRRFAGRIDDAAARLREHLVAVHPSMACRRADAGAAMPR